MTGDMAFTDVVGFTAPVDQPVILAQGNAIPESDYWSDNTGWQDVRAYQSIMYSHEFSGGTWGTSDYISVDIIYANNPDGTDEVYRSSYLMFADRWKIIDVVHGNYVRVFVEDVDSVGLSTNWTYKLYGSYRPVSAPWLGDLDNLVLYTNVAVNLAAGGNIQFPTGKKPELGVGRAMMRVQSGAAGAARFRLNYGSGSSAYDEVSVAAANSVATKEIILPRIQAIPTFFNDAAAVQTIRASVFMQVYPQ